MISLSSQAGLWMMMIFGTDFCVSFSQTHPRDAVRSAWTSLLVWDVWASLLNPSKPRIFPLWLLFKMAGSAIRDDKIVLGAVMNGFVCRCSASPLPQLFTPRQGEVLTERDTCRCEGKGSLLVPQGKKSAEPSIWAVVNLELFRLEKVFQDDPVQPCDK